MASKLPEPKHCDYYQQRELIMLRAVVGIQRLMHRASI
jgi:hypothetical protein